MAPLRFSFFHQHFTESIFCLQIGCKGDIIDSMKNLSALEFCCLFLRCRSCLRSACRIHFWGWITVVMASRRTVAVVLLCLFCICQYLFMLLIWIRFILLLPGQECNSCWLQGEEIDKLLELGAATIKLKRTHLSIYGYGEDDYYISSYRGYV